ncbi:MAG: diguanylate cyclase [Polyangiales bacterium]
MPVSLERSVSDVTVQVARELVERAPVRLPMPDELCEGLELQRARNFGRLVGPGTPIVLGLTFVLIATGLALFGPDFSSVDARRWWMSEAVALLTASFGLWLVRRPEMLPRFAEIVGAGSALVLGTKLFVLVGTRDTGLAVHAAFVCVLTITLIALAFRLPPTHVLAAYAGAVGVALAFVFASAPTTIAPTSDYLGYVAGYAFIALGIAHFAERQERITYLQSVLLAYESARSRHLNAELERIARTDPLTSIANRRTFDEHLKKEWERARRAHDPVALLFVDVDHFKAFNDTYGHPAGDACLARVAEALARAARRPADLVARYGGEEFVVLLPDTDRTGAKEVAEAVLGAIDALELPHRSSRAASHVTVSIGVAILYADTERDETALTQAADLALYRAKHEGRHCIRMHAGEVVSSGEVVAIKRA